MYKIENPFFVFLNRVSDGFVFSAHRNYFDCPRRSVIAAVNRLSNLVIGNDK
jgi:hypothetical protein